MKLLTLNTHSLEEKDMERKLQIFADFIADTRPDVIALQEVNQTMTAPVVSGQPADMVPVQNTVPLRQDNYALALSQALHKAGLDYTWCWLPIKIGYSKYDEGLAIFSRKPIEETADLLVSAVHDYTNYRTRRILGIRNADGWFFDIHMSWWGDPDEPFLGQWERLCAMLPEQGPVYLMGDFNGDAQTRHETYDLVASDGWMDTYPAARQRDEGWTVSGTIDGWRNQQAAAHRRIDQIWSRKNVPVLRSSVHFNGKQEPVISDHFALMAEIENS